MKNGIMDAKIYLEKNSEKLSQKYPGKYIAVVDGEVIAVDISPAVAFNKAKEKAGKKEIAVFYMPTDEEMVTLLIL